MKKLILSTIFVSFIFVFGYSQNTNYKIIKKDGKIYYNKNLPVYFWISTTPNDNSGDVLMTSHSTKSYANPMYFDTEGYNTLQTNYASDSLKKKFGHQEYKIYADGYPPELNVYFRGSRKYVSGKFYYNTQLKVEIKAKDYISGIEKIMYSINDEDYKVYTNPLSFEVPGKYKLTCYAVDIVGNQSKIYTFNFNVK